MRFPNDTSFHLRMATLLVASLFLEHMASTRLSHWSAPQVGIITFVLGLAWVALTAFYHVKGLANDVRLLKNRVDDLTLTVDALQADQRDRRSLPPMR